MDKPEYIRRLKRLLKKYHPDLRGGAETAENETAVRLVNTLNSLKADKGRIVNPESGEKKNDGYDFYRQGIKYYRNIHPGKFYNRNADGTYETKPLEELDAARKEISLSFDLAEACFNRVIAEYPRSPWLEDSKQKIQLLKKLRARYANMNLTSGNIIDAKQFTGEMGLSIL